MNLGEEVILTLLWQSGASESATVCFVISLSICYWLFKCRVLQVVCVRERERDRPGHITSHQLSLSRLVCVCVWEKERERERGGVISQRRVQPVGNHLNRGLFANANTYEHFRARTDGKTKDIINCLYYNLESWGSRSWKGALHFRCSLWCSANHNALCQLANQNWLRLLEGGTL